MIEVFSLDGMVNFWKVMADVITSARRYGAAQVIHTVSEHQARIKTGITKKELKKEWDHVTKFRIDDEFLVCALVEQRITSDQETAVFEVLITSDMNEYDGHPDA